MLFRFVEVARRSPSELNFAFDVRWTQATTGLLEGAAGGADAGTPSRKKKNT